MKQEVHESVSVWMGNNPVRLGAQPEGSLDGVHADVIVVGAGIAGLTTAYLLTKAGKKVVVLCDEPVGCGQTGRTTAHLASAIDDRYVMMEKYHGEKGARLAAESHSGAIDLMESISQEENIACDFTRLDGYLFLGEGSSRKNLEEEGEAARRSGLTGVTLLPHIPVASFFEGPCLQFPQQGQFDPLKYLLGLAEATVRRNGKIYSGVRVVEVEGGSPAKVKLNQGQTLTADSVVVASNTPINDRFVMHTKQAPYRTYAIAFEVPEGAFPKALFWDTEDPYHYIRMMNFKDKQCDYVIVGGEDHKTGQSDDEVNCLDRLSAWARQRIPVLGKEAFRWSGQVLETIDGLAYIGRNPGDEPNVFIATGDSGMGMTHGTIAGRILSDLILGRENPWAKLYDPSRKTLRAAKEWVRENINVALQYRDYLTGGDVPSLEAIKPGKGAIVRQGLHKIAVYRDENGKLNECSAVCPHLGGIVRWNEEEKTWDCPAHGSRFSPGGKVLEGPAVSDLEKIDIDQAKSA